MRCHGDDDDHDDDDDDGHVRVFARAVLVLRNHLRGVKG